MLFNSDVFLRFFAAFLLLYYLARGSLRLRNLLLVAASYLFYGWWDYRFLALLLASTVLDFSVGLGLQATQELPLRRAWLGLSLAGNLGMLGFFKYYGFFAESFATLLGHFGLRPSLLTLHVVLPVGISFYTFQTLSYAIDVFRRKIPATRDFLRFATYVSFFPQLVAGPIERGGHLLPQFSQTRTIARTMVIEGLWLMIWGMFKKVVVADNLAPLVEMVYHAPPNSSPMVILATIAFGLQIYGDFSGYSDIARGIARVLGFELMLNFNLPYLATNPRDFWRRWHISLSTWLRDYLYISLGGNRLGRTRTALNLWLTMLLGGLWHGAAWNYVLWGCWHGGGLVAHRAWSGDRNNAEGRWKPLAWAGTVLFVSYGWLLFRAGSLERILALTSALAHWNAPPYIYSYLLSLTVFSAPLLLMQWWQSRSGDLLIPLRLPPLVLGLVEGLLIWSILIFWRKDSTPFIYFQF